MPFDPDKYLAAGPAFNPDAYLNTKQALVPGKAETFGRNLLEGLTFNLSGELGGVGAKIGDWFASRAPWDGSKHGVSELQPNPNVYREERDAIDARLAETSAAHPGLALAGQVAGGIALPLPGAAAAKGATLGAKALKGVGIGAASGVLSGAGAAKELSDIPESAAIGGALGGALGGAIPVVGAGVGKAIGAGKRAAAAAKKAPAVIRERAKEVAVDKAVDVVADLLPLPGFAQRAVGRAIKGALNTGRVKKAVEQATPSSPQQFQFSDDAAAALERPRLDADDVPSSVYADPAKPKTLFNPKGDVPEGKNLGAEKIYTKPPRVDVSSIPRVKPEQSFDEMVAEAFRQQDAAKARASAVSSDAADARIAEIKLDGAKTGAPLNLSVAPSRPLGENEVDVGIRSLLKSAKRDAAAREAAGIQAPAEGSMGSQLRSILSKPVPQERLGAEAEILRSINGSPRVPQSDDDLAALLQASLRRK